MDAPRQIKIAIVLSWAVLVIQTAERLWGISIDPDANNHTRFAFIWLSVTASTAVVVALFIVFASRRRNWGRIALLVSTLAGWSMWLFYPRGFAEYLWWQWLAYGILTGMEVTALILLFRGAGATWYRTAAGLG